MTNPSRQKIDEEGEGGGPGGKPALVLLQAGSHTHVPKAPSNLGPSILHVPSYLPHCRKKGRL